MKLASVYFHWNWRTLLLGVCWERKTSPAGYGKVRCYGDMSKLDVCVYLLPCLCLHLEFQDATYREMVRRAKCST